MTEPFVLSQVILLFIIVGLYYYIRSRTQSDSSFRSHEWEQDRSSRKTPRSNDKTSPFDAQKLLSGLSIDGPPHEILGIPLTASRKEIQKAYRELMKHYHPDRVARPGTPQWLEAQNIAQALARARDEMLAKL